MKRKIDCYEVSVHGKTYKVLKFPVISNCWAFWDWADEVYMIDGNPDAMSLVRTAMAGLIADPSIIAFFPIRHEPEESYGGSMTYDAVLCRPELQFPRKLWPEIRRKLDCSHWNGKYTIHHNPQKIDDWCNRKYEGKYWLYRKLDKQIIYDLRASTVFFVLPKGILYHYHKNISHALKIFEPDDVYGIPAGIGYVMPEMYPVDSEN